jgi:hypothetical protein
MLTRGVFFVKFREIDILLQAFTLNSMDTTITLSVDKDLIQQARQQAASENTTLEALLLEWLAHYVEQGPSSQYQDLMARLSHIQAGRPFSREEMNERG